MIKQNMSILKRKMVDRKRRLGGSSSPLLDVKASRRRSRDYLASPAERPTHLRSGNPRANSCALMRRFPSSCTSPNDNALSPAATINSLSLRRISPGAPLRPKISAENIFKLRGSFNLAVIFVNAPGHGSNARIFRAITAAGSEQSILPFFLVNFDAQLAR